MATLPTVRIVCPKDPTDYWIINLSEYDQARHVLWEERLLAQEKEQPVEQPVEQSARSRRSGR